MKTKILLIQPCYVNFGGYYRSFSIAKSLSNKGYSVDLLISSKENSLNITKIKVKNNFNIYELPRINFHHFINGKIIRGLIGCFFIIFKKYDFIHLFSSVHPEIWFPLSICKMFRKKYILDWDDYWQDSPMYHSSTKITKKYIEFSENYFVKKSSHVTVTSDFLYEKAKQLGVKDALKIINGVDFDSFHPISQKESRKYLKLDENEKIILSFGNTYGDKRAYLLLKTFQYIYELDNSVKLYLNLDPRNFLSNAKIKQEIDKRIFDNIVVTGYIDKNMMPYYTGACDIILFLTGNTNGEKACFPIRIGSYLNAEKVIATNVTDTEMYNTLARFNCILIGKNPQDLAKNIIGFFNNKQMKKDLEKNTVKAKNELDWDNLSLNLIKLYKSVNKEL